MENVEFPGTYWSCELLCMVSVREQLVWKEVRLQEHLLHTEEAGDARLRGLSFSLREVEVGSWKKMFKQKNRK